MSANKETVMPTLHQIADHIAYGIAFGTFVWIGLRIYGLI